jgi:hypothetical protein
MPTIRARSGSISGTGRLRGVRAAEIIHKTRRGEVIEIDREELAALLEACEHPRAVDTRLAGWIRILTLDGQVVAQEETPEGEILLRAFDSPEAAGDFVDSRLADYDRMWDGCGCRIDYHS